MRIEQILSPGQISCDSYSTKCELISLAETVAQIGISAQEATTAMANLSEVLMRLEALEEEMSDIRSALDEKTENPKQKDDLEILNRIVPSEDFLILGDVGWSADIINLDKTNMFLG